MKYLIAFLSVVLGLLGCGEPQEAQHYQIPVVADGTTLEPFESEEGYLVEIDRVQMWMERVEFTVGGEAHNGQALRRKLKEALVGVAHAHPGHAAGGEVAGELGGPFLLEWRAGEVRALGAGTFLEGNYEGYNLYFGTEDPESDRHYVISIAGRATKDEVEYPFLAYVQAPRDRQVIGGAFEARLPAEGRSVALQFLPLDEYSGGTIFRRVRFSENVYDDLVMIEPGTLAHAELRAALESHEFYGGRTIGDGGSDGE